MTGKFQPTHKVSFWGVKCYFNEYNHCLIGTNRIYDYLINVAVWFHNAMSEIAMLVFPNWEQRGFPFKILREYEEEYWNTKGAARDDINRWWER